jgi:hypothetical protein
MAYTYTSETPITTVSDLRKRLIDDISVIKHICENSNPTYRTRISQIRAVIKRLDADLSAMKVRPTPNGIGHHRFSHDGPCPEGCYYETTPSVERGIMVYTNEELGGALQDAAQCLPDMARATDKCRHGIMEGGCEMCTAAEPHKTAQPSDRRGRIEKR